MPVSPRTRLRHRSGPRTPGRSQRERARRRRALSARPDSRRLPGSAEKLPPHYALQHPHDWIDSAAQAMRTALKHGRAAIAATSSASASTSPAARCCRRSPTARRSASCRNSRKRPLAWPKLWKHHGAQDADRPHQRRRPRAERTVAQALRRHHRPRMVLPQGARNARGRPGASTTPPKSGSKRATGSSGNSSAATPSSLPRSTCQAGYKGMWSRDDGFPSRDFFAAVHPKLANVVERKMPGRLHRARASRPAHCRRDGQEARPAGRHARERRDHRRPRRRARRRRRRAGHARDGHGHQQLPHAQRRPKIASSPAWPAS